MPTNEAFDEGYDAYWEGVDVADNPHHRETGKSGACFLGRRLERSPKARLR